METMKMMASEILNGVLLGMFSLMCFCIITAIKAGMSMLQERASQVKEEFARNKLKSALADVENLVIKTVGAVEQTTAKRLREEVKAGIAPRSDLTSLGEKVFDDVTAALPVEVQAIITEHFGDFEEYLGICIEDAVRKVKQENPCITLNAEMAAASEEGGRE